MIPLLFALLLAQEKATVEGTVLNALTNEPLRKVHVLLFGVHRYEATTGADGKFHFESVEPEEYEPQAQRAGFLDADDEDSFEVEPGEHKKDLVVKLTPQGIIAGRVLDEDGDPIPDAGVGIERAIQIDGHKHTFESNWGSANSEGYFFLGDLKPGHYYLKAQAKRRGRSSGHNEILGADEYFAAADFPVELQLAPGGDLRNVEIRMKKAITFRVRGKLSNPPIDQPSDQPSLSLSNESGETRHSPIMNEEFEFNGVAPGSYVITVSSFHRNQDGAMIPVKLFCRLPVTVSDHDVDGVTVELAPGPNIKGTIKMVGGGQFAKPPSLSLQVLFGNLTVEAKEDGSFEWLNLPPDKHGLNFAPPEGTYVKSIQLNHQPVIDRMIDLSSGDNSTLEIVVAPNAATISATVRNASNVRIALWNDSGFERVQGTDAGDSASFKNLAPGEYRIAAFPKMDPDYAYVKEFRSRFNTQKIIVREGSNETVEMNLIPKSAVDAEVAKLQ